jgi:hypothetical protein
VSRGTRERNPGRRDRFAYGALTLSGAAFQPPRLRSRFVTSRPVRNRVRLRPTTPRTQRFRAMRVRGLGSFPFARRYLGNHSCFLFPGLLRCFSSPRSPRAPMDSARDAAVLPAAGFPIRKSADRSLFGSSPRLIAAFHVLRRLLTPRHPPSALTSLATNHPTQISRRFRILVSRFDFQRTPTRTRPPRSGDGRVRTDDLLRARQALSRLSYAPGVVGLDGFEPSTSRLSGVRSNRLSYRPRSASFGRIARSLKTGQRRKGPSSLERR